MKNVNLIQNAIMQLEGGAFQKLFDEYLYKKYKFKNIQTLGVQTGTNKPTKGTPDSYVPTDDGKFILINYGSVSTQPADKIRSDILSCFDAAKLLLPKDKIKKIICGHCSTNIHIEQFNSIMETIEGVEIELIGIDTISHDLALLYPHIAKDELGIAIDTNQFFDVEDFVKAYDVNGINAPIDCEFLHREAEFTEVCNSLCKYKATILTGPSGIGKTRLALEACREYAGGSLKVYCVKSNGNLLYEDIKYYISDPGKYLIFFDDANMVASLDNVLNTVLTLSNDYEISILITVRDYAKDRVVSSVSKYTAPNIIDIGPFKDDEIKDILREDLGILNSDYLNKITDIADGNIRLAFLAGIRSVDNGYQAIHNAEDIFKNYYGRIIDEATLKKEDILILFFITVAGPVKDNENQFFSELMKLYGVGITENNVIEHLYSLELIDWFKNEITKVSDQSLGNYILYYVLFEKRWINLESVIAVGFPRYRNKIVYALNTLMNLFASEELEKYVKDSIISAWDNAPIEQDKEYLESFYQIYSEKALSIIKRHIEQEIPTDFDLHNFDINNKKNYHNISTKEIEILCGFKYTENFEDALDLLMLYFTRRPDLIMDFYFAFSDRLLYDKYSWKNKYKEEKLLLDRLWCKTEEGRNFNNTLLYLQIAECALRTEISFTESIRNSRSVNFVRMTLSFCEELATIRADIWKNLAVLRELTEYRSAINGILSEVHFNGTSKDDSKEYLLSDFDTIYKCVINKDAPDFFDARIVARYEEMAEQLGVAIDERFLISERNQEFLVYKMLTREHLIGRTIEEDEQIRKGFIAKEISIYKSDDFQKLFVACQFLEIAVPDRDLWSLNIGLDCVFELLESDGILYLDVLGAYLEMNAPLKPNRHRQAKYLLDHIGYEDAYKFIFDKKFDKRDFWLTCLWECLPEKDINRNVVDDFKSFMLPNLNRENPIIPPIQVLDRYSKKDRELKVKIIEKVIEDPKLSANIIGYAYREEDVESILQFFQDDIDALEQVYMCAIENNVHIDYDGRLFIIIYQQKPEIWNVYVNWLKNNINRDGREQKIFERIWTVENWCECINQAFEILIDDSAGLWITESAKLLFAKSNDNVLMNRRKQWLLDKLHERISDIEKCRKLIDVVVTAFPDWKQEFILEFLKENRKVENFEKLNLFPLSCSWTGSEIPLILEKIDFLQSLKEALKGIDYIDHRKYIEDYKRKLEEYREKVELREYLENADYA